MGGQESKDRLVEPCGALLGHATRYTPGEYDSTLIVICVVGCKQLAATLLGYNLMDSRGAGRRMVISSSADLTATGALIAFASVLAGSLGVPVPTFAAIIFVGSLLATRHGSVDAAGMVFAAAMAGAILGDTAWFFAGRRYGTRVLGQICRLSLSRDSCVRRTADVFERRGVKVLLFARFIPGLSVISAPLAGISGVSLPRFIAYAETGAAFWIGTGLALGLLLADQVGTVLLDLEHFGLSLGGLGVALILAYVGFAWYRRHSLLRRLRIARITSHELAELKAAGVAPFIIDARSTFEQDADPFILPGALLLQDHQPGQVVAGISILRPVIVYCSCPNEVSAAEVATQMRKLGYTDVRPLLGGITAWRDAGYPVVSLRLSGETVATTTGLATSVLAETAEKVPSA